MAISNKDRLQKIVIIISTLLIIIGAFFIYFSRYHACPNVLEREITALDTVKSLKNGSVAIYLIREVNTGCRKCLDYDALRDQTKTGVVFYVGEDFSPIDIENFRDAFGIRENHRVETMPPRWTAILNKCNPPGENQYNMFVLVRNGNVGPIRKF